MGNVKNSMGRQTGKLFGNMLGNAIANATGLDQSEHRTYHNASREKIAERQAGQRDKKRLDGVDAAVLQNADSVRSIRFSNDIPTLVETIYNLEIQLKSESWGHMLDEENRIRNKFTNTLFTKYCQGVDFLQRLDPFNADVLHFRWNRYWFHWKKVLYMWWFVFMILIAVPFALVEAYNNLPPLKESYDRLWIWLAIVAYVLIRVTTSNRYQISALLNKKRAKNNAESNLESTQLADSNDTTAVIPSDTLDESSDDDAAPFSMESVESIHDEIMNCHRSLWQRFGNVNPLMGRGFSYSRNSYQKDYLIVGFNPIESNLSDKAYSYTLPFDKYGSWGIVTNMLVSKDLSLRVRSAYLDLFPFRENNHAVAMEQVILNPQLFEYVVEQIKLTQRVIEEIIRPRVIVVTDQDEYAFWGKLPEFTWMGYKFEPVDVLNGFEVMRIKGFKSADDRINKDKFEDTNLYGTIVIFATREGVKKYPKAEELQHYSSKA